MITNRGRFVIGFIAGGICCAVLILLVNITLTSTHSSVSRYDRGYYHGYHNSKSYHYSTYNNRR